MAQKVSVTLTRPSVAGRHVEPLSIKHPNAAGVDIGGGSHYGPSPLIGWHRARMRCASSARTPNVWNRLPSG